MSRNQRKNPVQETASLHEKAVQAIAKGEVPKAPRKARKTAAVDQAVDQTYMGPVNSTVVLTAKWLIKNRSYTNWKAISETEVIVT